MQALNGQLWVNATVELDDFALIGFPHANVVDVADIAAPSRKLRQCDLHRSNALWRRLTPRQLASAFPSYFVLPYDQLQSQP